MDVFFSLGFFTSISPGFLLVPRFSVASLPSASFTPPLNVKFLRNQSWSFCLPNLHSHRFHLLPGPWLPSECRRLTPMCLGLEAGRAAMESSLSSNYPGFQSSFCHFCLSVHLCQMGIVNHNTGMCGNNRKAAV